ncbi:MAG: D-aminoacyl-tRNA deacylase [Nanoarchaeota archaeon]|nr:D-aminoacyl-tRNA deacylase [Nanoarchaeota archaeon]
MYKKILIIASKLDKAGINIVNQLAHFGNFNLYVVEGEAVYTENLDLEKVNSFDFVIFASKHVSERGDKTLSVHAPGNWRSADFGGVRGKVCKTSALFMKQAFERLDENVRKYELKNYKVTLEATHHGPLLDKPCMFIEIGSTETEWTDRRAGFIIAKTISETIENFKENPNNEVAIAIGGPHYCPNFNDIQLKSNVAISHVIPQYAFPLTEEMVKEAIEKTEEEVDMFLLNWKGLGQAERREEVMEILDKFHIPKKKTGEIGKGL